MIFSIFEYNLPMMEMIILILAISAVFIISLSLHEWAHCFVAHKQGDLTPKMAGRLTLNPLEHIDPMGFVMFLCIGIGWGKPAPINPNNFKKYRSGIAKVSLAGVAANFVLCVIGSFLYMLSLNLIGDNQDLIVIIFEWLMFANACLMVFNLLPIYPLDGFNFISSFLRGDNKFVQANIRNSGRILIIVLFVDLFLEWFVGYSIIGFIISWLASWIYSPFCWLWGLMF